MTLNKSFALVGSAVLLATLSACATAGTELPASDITQNRDNSSWCQGAREIRYENAPAAGIDDPGNQFDTDDTVAEIQASNVRLRAACPDLDASEP